MSPKRQPLHERFFSKVRMTDGCWVWTGCLNSSGYGYMFHAGRPRPVHRMAYRRMVGPIPPDSTIDHLCRNRACVRPDHLEATSFRENVLRGTNPAARNARKTHCIRGHPFDEENTYIAPGSGKRQCRACYKASYPKRNARRREKERAAS